MAIACHLVGGGGVVQMEGMSDGSGFGLTATDRFCMSRFGIEGLRA